MSDLLLEVENLSAGYGKLQILRGVSLHARPGECVALLGPNGAGKTTLLRAVARLIPPASGTIRFHGRSLEAMRANHISRMGIGYISEQSNLFLAMTVEENILLGAYALAERKKAAERREFVFDLFPRLKERRRQPAGTLSGGERKMLGLARGLMSGPQILLVDEPSLGLAPKVIESLFATLQKLNKLGMALLVVEQNVPATLALAARAYVLEQGRVAFEGASRDLMENDHVKRSYLGVI